jgi:hypothetical protein
VTLTALGKLKGVPLPDLPCVFLKSLPRMALQAAAGDRGLKDSMQRERFGFFARAVEPDQIN